MKNSKKLLAGLCLLLFFTLNGQAQQIAPLYSPKETRNAAQHYIKAYKPLAYKIWRSYGIPPHIILAIAGLESSWGRSELAVKANNHFGIKAVHKWNGKVYWKYSSEYVPGAGTRRYQSAFRLYNSVAKSYEDFGVYMRMRGLYDELFKIPASDYRRWAQALQDSGYASDKQYAEKLIRVLEDHKLVIPSSSSSSSTTTTEKVSRKQGILLHGGE